MADTCPKCGQAAVGTDRCPGCGVIIPIYESYLEKVRRGPGRAPAGSAPPAGHAAPPPATGARRPRFHGTGGTLFGIQIVAALLTIVTLGIYYPWAKTRVRKYLFAQTEFEGDRFAYHGTGNELFVGLFKASLYYGIPVTVLNAIGSFAGGVVAVVTSLAVLALTAVFVPVAIVGARRYRLSRTSWRGIRFSFRGDTTAFIKLFVKWTVLNAITLGLYYPVFIARRHAFLTKHSYVGNARFGFDGAPGALRRPFFTMIAGAVPVLVLALLPFLRRNPFGIVLGLILAFAAIGGLWINFVAAKRRYVWGHTTLGGARFQCRVTTGALAKLYAVNVVLFALTFGLAMSWIKVRNAVFACENLALAGDIDVAGIVQDARHASTTGEGLSGFFDTDIGIA